MSDYQTGLVYCWHRYYDPRIGRWISHDPIGLEGGVNTYAYCSGDPVQYVDPSGLAKICLAWSPVANTKYHHAFIIRKDEKSGKIFVIEGGPADGWKKDKLVDFSGWIMEGAKVGSESFGFKKLTPGEEYEKRFSFDRHLLLDDDNTAQYWVDQFELKKPNMEGIGYRPLNWSRYYKQEGNSNSYIREVLERLGFDTKIPENRTYPKSKAYPKGLTYLYNRELPRWYWDPWRERDGK